MAYEDEVLADSPYVYLKLSEASGTVAQDASGNDRDGTYYPGNEYESYPNPWTGAYPQNQMAYGQPSLLEDPADKSVLLGSVISSKFGQFTLPSPTSDDFTIEFVMYDVEPGWTLALRRSKVTYTGGVPNSSASNVIHDRVFDSFFYNGYIETETWGHVASTEPDIRQRSGYNLSMLDGVPRPGGNVASKTKTHVAIVRKGSTITRPIVRESWTDDESALAVYINGVLAQAAPLASGGRYNPTWDHTDVAGTMSNGTEVPADGPASAFSSSPMVFRAKGLRVDEVAYYDTGLSSARIAAHAAALPTGLKGTPSLRRLTGSGTMSVPLEASWTVYLPSLSSSGTIIHPVMVSEGAALVPEWVGGGYIEAEAPPPALQSFVGSGRIVVGMEDAIDLGTFNVTPTVDVTVPAFETVKAFPLTVMRPKVRVNVGYRFESSHPDRAVYRVMVVDQAGVPQYELSNAIPKDVPWAVTGTTTFQFDVPADSEDVLWCEEWRREVQVWRNNRLLWWGVMIRLSDNGKIVNVQCADLDVYFNRRVMGRVPKKNLLATNGDGEPGNVKGWKYRSLPRSGDDGPPAVSTTKEDSYNDQSAMRLSSSAGREKETFENDEWYDGTRLTAKAKKDLRRILEPLAEFTTNRPRLMVSVYDDTSVSRDRSDERSRDRAEAVADWVLDQYPKAKVVIDSPAYRKPLNNNGTPEKRAANRRTVVIYKTVDGAKGHKQHAYQSVILRNPGTKERKQRVTFSCYVNVENEVGWAAEMKGVELVRSDPKKKHPDKKWADAGYTKVLQTSGVPFGDGIQAGVWFRVECTVVLPNDGKRSVIEVRLFPPNGDALFSEMWLTKEESLSFRSKEQADIIRALVQHAQDPDMGKSDLNISTNIVKTGVRRTRDYPFDERAKIGALLEEFPKLGNGVEWRIMPYSNQRVFTTFFPRMGKDTTVVLAAGSNVVSYGVGSDGSLLSTTVVIQAPTGEGSDREERTVSDPTLMDGLVLEQVYTGTPNSPASSWRRQAERGLARYRRPVVIPDVTLDPNATDELLEAVSIGDLVTTDISNVVKNIDVFQKARVTEMYLNPATDALRYVLTPEDLNIRVLSGFGQSVRYKSQAQNPIVGASGKEPVESNVEYAGRGFNDASWSTGPAGVGWVQEATGDVIRNPQHFPATTVPDNHEVWIRKWVKCTGDMVLTVRVADWGYVYVNGNRVGNRHFDGYNVVSQVQYVNLRIPSSWLDPSGDQLVALHAQFNPARRSSSDMDSLYADVAVRGTFDAGEIA